MVDPLKLPGAKPPADLFTFRGAPVEWSHDLKRVVRLPRRKLDPMDPAAAVAWTKHLRRERSPEEGPCDCVKRFKRCILDLLPIQGWALEEASDWGGLLAIIGVGHGKTPIDILLPMAIPGVKVAVLLIPAKARRQFFEKHYPQLAAHWKVPNLAGYKGFWPGRPVLTVLTYEELSLAKNSDILTRLCPDLVIADEANKLKDKKSARTRRFLRAFKPEGMDFDATEALEPIKFVALSGTMTSKSLKDYAHLSRLALRDRSPLPHHQPTLDSWASALDPLEHVAPAGALKVLCEGSETVQEGFARRLAETPGVVVTTSASVSCALFVSAHPLAVPETLEEEIQRVRDTAVRPDGEEADCALVVAGWLDQLSSGFYYRMIFPRGEPEPTILKWLDVRKAYHREVRKKLERAREFMDSPLLLARAAINWHDGYTHEGRKYPPHTRSGPRPVWESEFWPEWRAIRHSVKPSSEAVWLDDFMVDAAAAWGKTNKGIIWARHNELGQRVAGRLGLPYYDGGNKNPELDEDGSRTIVVGVKATTDAMNLQAWSKNLLLNAISAGDIMEQVMGRTHRQGQEAEEVTFEVVLHTPEMRKMFDTACNRAWYIQTTNRNPQKLCFADIDLTGAVDGPA